MLILHLHVYSLVDLFKKNLLLLDGVLLFIALKQFSKERKLSMQHKALMTHDKHYTLDQCS